MQTRVAIDIGGGFADLSAMDVVTGKMYWAKTYTTPEDLQQCVRTVFEAGALDPQSVQHLLHGQTLVINAILQRTGAKVGLITTRGFRDILAIQRANRRDIFNLQYQKPEPFVPRSLRFEVAERTAASGSIVAPLDEAELRACFDALVAQDVDAIAIALINSYANPANEHRARTLIEEWGAGLGKKVYLTVSSEVCREWREYERTSTAVLNAYVQPALSRYLTDLEKQIRGVGVNGTFSMMISGGGVASFTYAERCPIETIESGPVAGIVGATRLGEIVGERNLIALDGGSTTTKASLVEDLTVRYRDDYAVERDRERPGYPVKVPVVDVVEIGIGGNSVVWVDNTGTLAVGPRNAGAVVGPVAYGRGGTQPTLTDAYLATGFLNPKTFLGGALQIRADLALDAFSATADRFGVTPIESAAAAIQTAIHGAAQLLRLISVQRGVDQRDFCLIAYGGSGPLLAAAIAAELEIPRVLIPVIPPGNFSAWGLLMSDLKHTLVRTVLGRLDEDQTISRLADALAALTAEVQQLFVEDRAEGGVVYSQHLDLRYYGQEHTLRIPLSDVGEPYPVAPLHRLAKEVSASAVHFQQRHLREFGFTIDAPVEMVNLVVTGEVATKKPSLEPMVERATEAAEPESRDAFWPGFGLARTSVYRRRAIGLGMTISGPAIIEEDTTTITVPAGAKGSLDRYGNFIIERKRA